MQNIKSLLPTITKKGPNSFRSSLIQDIADMTGMPFMVVFGKVNHLKGVEGTEKLRQLYVRSLQSSTDIKWRAIRFWQFLRESKEN